MSNKVIENLNTNLLNKIDPEATLKTALCLQCGRCSSGCTMRQETDILPHQINRMVLLGLEEELLNSRAIWACISCQTCVSRCPMGVDTPALIDRLRHLAGGAPADMQRVKAFNDEMLKSIEKYGRTYEFGLMAAYKLKTRDLFSDVKKFPKMLVKGKMRLLPPKTRGKTAVANIFRKTLRARRSGQ